MTTEGAQMNDSAQKIGRYWIDLNSPIEMVVDRSGEFVNQEISGVIYGSLDDDSNREIKIGSVELLKMDVGHALSHGETPFTLFDLFDDGTAELGDVLIDPETHELRDRIHDKEIFPPDILIFIRNLQVYPSYRGKGLGLLALHSIIRTYCGLSTAFVLKSFPLQFDEVDAEKYKHLALENFHADKTTAKERLSAYYKKLGFWQIDDTDLYYFASEYAHPLPKELEPYKC
jgi:GNAT superfamily N-acetyltransferase